MNYKVLIFIALFVISSCKYNYSYNQKIFLSNGFVLIYNDKDLQEKIISKKLINDKLKLLITLPYGTLLNLEILKKIPLDVKVLKIKISGFYELL